MQIKTLSCRLGRKEILNDLSFTLKEGRITALLGKNGSGKTTLLKCLSDLIKPSNGEIIVDDKALTQLNRKEKSQLFTYLPQTLPTPAISVESLLKLGRYPFTDEGRHVTDRDNEFISSALEKTGMQAMKDRLVCHLSGGERTLAYVSMLLAKDSKYNFLDEPFASLDVPSHKKLAELLNELKIQDKVILLSIHDLILATEIADDIILLDQGKLIFEGTKEDFLSSRCYEEIFQAEIKNLKDEDGNEYSVLKYSAGKENTK